MVEYKPPDFQAPKTLVAADTHLANSDFFPELDVQAFQLRYRVSGIHESQLLDKLMTAMQRVNRELMNPASLDTEKDWVSQQREQGFHHLSDVPSLAYGEITEKIHQYQTAVYAYAKALLLERYNEQEPRSEHLMTPDLMKTAEEYQQESREAIRLLLDKPRCSIELL